MSKKVLAAGIIMAGLLSGCATDVAQDNKIAALQDQVSQLSADVAATKRTAVNAQAEAERANQRINNIATSYKK